MPVNREYKSTVFTSLFSDTRELLSLYNAIMGLNLPETTYIEIATLEDDLFKNRLNDIAFVVEDRIVVLVEHQSTVSENMPLRMLIYMARIYEKLVNFNSVYRKALLKIPKPNFIVLYNGLEPFPDEKILRLSDAYKDDSGNSRIFGGSMELEVRVLNINKGSNLEIIR